MLRLSANSLCLPISFLCSCVSGLSALSLRGSELSELSQLAWKGLEESKILFLKEDIDPKILEFSVKTGILSQVFGNIF